MGKTVLLLGAGAMGSLAARIVSGFGEVGSLILTSLDLGEAEQAAQGCQGKATAEAVNVTDKDKLVSLMRRADVVLNCVGPFFRFGVPVLEAAIEAGTNYLDICDDPEPTKDMLDLGDRAKAAGVTAVIGMGASPGINNLLGALVVERLDEVDRLVAGWNIEEATDDSLDFSAAIIHWMQQCSGTILQCQDGRLTGGKPLEDLCIDYPGLGSRTIYTVGHPEPVSFHYTWPHIRQTRCGMVMPSAWIGLFRKYRDAIDSGKMTLEEAGKSFVDEASHSGLIDLLKLAWSRLTDGTRLPRFFVLGDGRKAGRPATVAASLTATPPNMAEMTGIPLALGTLLHLRGQTKGPGVLPPEAAFTPAPFFELLAPYCTLPCPVSAEELVAVEQS
jgi:saccharopine dehydrogenase-like NADP-dependent oxidoreductase